MTSSTDDFALLCRLVSDLCGMNLDESKQYFLESRLAELASNNDVESHIDLVRQAAYADSELRDSLIDAITVKETQFFRDGATFAAFQKYVVPELVDQKARCWHMRQLRIWSAACSTGQEPYSIAIALRETLPDPDAWSISIYATDISRSAIHQAQRGWYTAHEIARGLPQPIRDRYFVPSGDGWKVIDQLRQMITFVRSNLLDTFPVKGPFDVIFCRNVAIYFKPEQRRDLFLRLADAMPRHGYLIVGSTESLSDLGPRFKTRHAGAAIYQPNLGPAVRS